MTNIWDRIRADPPLYTDDEPLFWFNRFDRYYRPMGSDRSILGAYKLWLSEKGRLQADKLPRRAPDAWYENARTWRWQARAEAWDEMLRQDRLREEMSLIEEMNERHLTLVRGVLTMAAKKLTQILGTRDAPGNDEWDKLTPTELLRYIAEGVKNERLLRGLPTDAFEAISMSDDELLRKYRHLLAAAAGDIRTGNSTAWSDSADD